MRPAREHLDDIIRLARLVFLRSATSPDELARIDLELVELDELIEARMSACTEPLPLERLRDAFQLEPTEQRCLWLAIGFAASSEVRQAAGYSAGIPIEAFDRAVYASARVRDRFAGELGGNGRLLRYGLREVDDTGDVPRFARIAHVADAILDHAYGLDQLGDDVARFASFALPADAPLLVAAELGQALGRALRAQIADGRGPIPVLRGVEGAGKRSLIAATALELGAKTLVADCRRIPRSARAFVAVQREAILHRAVLVFSHVEDAVDSNQAKRLRDVRKAKTLFEAIETLGTQHAKGEHRIDDKHDADARAAHEREHHVSETNALAILEQYRTEVPALLNEPSHRPSVMKLATLLDVPPNLAIPWLDAVALARMPNAVAWWMAFRDPLALLHQLANNPQAIAVVAEAISANTMGALHWLERMPKGFELDSLEDRVIEQLRTRLHANSEGVRALFRVRFGMPAPADYDVKLTNQLWDVSGRLPPDQLKQERISKFDVVPKEDMDAAGQYSPGDQRIDIAKGLEKNTDKDTFYSAAHEAWYTRAELQKAFGYSDAAFDQLASQGRFEVRVATLGPTPTTQYRMKEQTHDLFTQVVLHEVGHSVDDMLGSRTPPVWDYAGWHEYSNANFDQWAAEMGGWDEVSATDQKSIREAWISALGGKVAVSTLVDSEHPAVNTAKYKRVGIVTVGAAGKRLGFAERTQIGDRIFIAGTVEDAFFSVKASAAAVAPSDYALNAPAEYFAESYVEYYRGADGTPGSQDRKGGALASPVKQWFDEHVDRLKYDPKRFKGGASELMHDAGEQPMQANNAPERAVPSVRKT